MPFDHLVIGALRRGHSLFRPGGNVAQCLFQHRVVIDHPCWIFGELLRAVKCVFGVPDAIAIDRIRTVVLVELAAIPIRVPRHGFAVEQRIDGDDLAVESPGRHGSRRPLREHRPKQHLALRVERLAIGTAELVVNLVAGVRHLMAVECLRGEEVRIIDPHLVARLDLGDSPQPGNAQRDDIALEQAHGDLRALRLARQHDKVPAEEADIGRRAFEFKGDRALRSIVHRDAPCIFRRPARGAGDAQVGHALGGRLVLVERVADLRDELQPRLLQRFWRIEAEVAGLGPEILEIGGVGHDHALIERGEGMDPELVVIKPGLQREAHGGRFLERGGFLGIQALVGIAAAARVHRIDDLRELAVQDAHRVHADGEAVGCGHR